MKDLLRNESFKPLIVGKNVEGIVLGQSKGALFLDLGPLGTGIICGQEYFQNKEKLEKLKPGDKLLAKVVDLDNEEGYVELSISTISEELDFEILKQKKEKGEIFEVQILKANKGGLLTKISGIPAFLPVSQLLPEHYPKIKEGDKSKILKELQKFIGKKMKVKIITFYPEKHQIILAEEREKEISESLINKEFEGEIIGIFSFGILVKTANFEGLISSTENFPKENFKIGNKLKVKVTEIKNNKVFLSLLEKIG